MRFLGESFRVWGYGANVQDANAAPSWCLALCCPDSKGGGLQGGTASPGESQLGEPGQGPPDSSVLAVMKQIWPLNFSWELDSNSTPLTSTGVCQERPA